MEFKKLIPARTKQNNQKKKTVLKILDFFYSIFVGKKYDIKNVRRVYFGLSIRMTFLISIILIIILFITGTTFFLFQRQALFNEKNNKAASLTRILSDQAEYYLDKDINTSSLDRKNKLIYIKENSETFKKFNEDIIKIVLVNEKGTIEYSTYAPDIGRITNGSYLFKCLKERELQRYDFKENKKKYRAVAYPVFLSKGIILEVTTDFKKYYTKYHASKLNEKKKIYNALWKKYNTYLDNSLAPNATPIYAIQKNDIDFLLEISNISRILFNELHDKPISPRGIRLLSKTNILEKNIKLLLTGFKRLDNLIDATDEELTNVLKKRDLVKYFKEELQILKEKIMSGKKI